MPVLVTFGLVFVRDGLFTSGFSSVKVAHLMRLSLPCFKWYDVGQSLLI